MYTHTVKINFLNTINLLEAISKTYKKQNKKKGGGGAEVWDIVENDLPVAY